MNVPMTDCNDDVDNEDQDLAKDHPSTQLFVPAKTAPKKRKRKGDNTEILTEAVNLLKMAAENDASKEMLAFLKEDIEKSRELISNYCVPKMGYSSQLSILQRRPTIPICPPSPHPFELVLCQDMPECMVESPQEDHSQPQAPPQLRVIYCIISCLKMQAVLMSVPLIVIFKL